MLDSHTDQVAPSSVYDSFQGFLSVITSRESYPLANQNNIRIRPGHDNLVALSATDIKADHNIDKIALEKRC